MSKLKVFTSYEGSGAKILNFRYIPQFIFIPEVLIDVVEMMAERGLSLSHTTIMRWIHEYAPKIDKRTRPKFRQTGDSWSVDETYVKVKGKWMYLSGSWHRVCLN